MRNAIALTGLILLSLTACETTPPSMPMTDTIPTQLPTPQPTLTLDEQTILAGIGAQYEYGLYPSRADCIHAVENGAVESCVFRSGVGRLSRPEWMQLFPNTAFYIADISGWRSPDHLLPPQTQDGGTSRQVAAIQNGEVYEVEDFDRLLETNAIRVTDANRELVARAFALMSIPNYLHGEVRFLSWKPVPPGNYRYDYSYTLEAWTQIWGCEVTWWFAFTDTGISAVSLVGRATRIDTYGKYIEDTQYFELGDEAVPLGVPPYSRDFYFEEQ